MKDRKSRHGTSAALAAALFLGLAGAASAQNLVGERENFHNTAYIRTDDEEVKSLLFQFEEALRRQNLPEAVGSLLRALRIERPSMVPFGERTYLSVREAALRRIASLPKDALDLYMERAGEDAKRLLDEGPGIPERVRLQRAVRLFPLTRAAFTAMLALGDLAFERGEPLRASRWYRRFLDEASLLSNTARDGPRGSMVRAGLSLYISLRAAGEQEEAASFRPGGLLPLGGRTIDADELDRLLEANFPRTLDRTGGWPTRGGHPSRFRRPEFDGTALRYLWHYPLKDHEEESRREDLLDPLTMRFLDAKSPEAAVYPIAVNGTLYVFDDTAFHPLDLHSGTLRYGPLRWDWSLLFNDGPPELDNVTYSGTESQGVLYAVLNRRSPTPLPALAHRGMLVAMDLEREGLFLWRRGGIEEREDALENVAFTGAPAVVEGRVFILGTRYSGVGEARAEAVLFGFDAATGRLLFDVFLCSGAEVDRFEIRLGSDFQRSKDRVEIGSPLAEYGGVIYALTNLGVAGAVDAYSGEVLWLFKYNRVFSQDPDRYERDFLLDTGGWRNGLPLVLGERLYLTPEDSRYAYRLALKPDPEGFLILDDPIEKGRLISLVGVAGDEYIFTARQAGRNKIIALDGGGAVLWETTPFEKEDRITGQPLLTATAVFVPTERYLYRLDPGKGGLITHLFPLPEEVRAGSGQRARFGNIIAIQDYLVSVSRDEVIVLKGLKE